MNTLFVAWQQPDSGEWIPVARLERADNIYRFSYTQGVFRSRGFQPFNGMNKLDAVYESTVLFPLFSNRLINKSRPEFKEYLRWLGLPNMVDEPMAILALTGGIRGTDSIELFQPPGVTDDGRYNLEFFARSLSHLPKETIDLIGALKPGARLFLMRDGQNTFDPFALALRTESPSFFAGYCPKYYGKDLGTLLTDQNNALEVRVKCVNLDAPLNMRLLCSVTAKLPIEFSPLGNEQDFKPVANTVPVEWQNLTASFDEVLQDKHLPAAINGGR